MSKNLMSEVAKLLGLELGEKFNIQGLGGGEERFKAILHEKGLMLLDIIVNDGGNATYLEQLLNGNLEFAKLPWEPQEGERYFYPSVNAKNVDCTNWLNSSYDYAMKALGMVYRTRGDAEAHFAEDYEKLTGKKLGKECRPWTRKRKNKLTMLLPC